MKRWHEAIQVWLGKHVVGGLKAETGCGKTMVMPEELYKYLAERSDTYSPAILLVQKNVYTAEKVVDSLVQAFGWRRHRLHLRTGRHETDRFEQGWTQLSVITYGILWEWVKCDLGLLKRYNGIIFDEWADTSRCQ